MSWDHTGLSGIGTYLTDHAVGIALGDIEEFCATRRLIVGTGGIHHVSEVVEFVTGMLLCCPTPVGSPSVGMLRVDGTGGIEIAVGFLGCCHHIEHGVDVGLQLRIWVCLQYIRGPFDGLVDIGVIKRETHELCHIPLSGFQTLVSWVLQGVCRHLEILVAVLTLALRKSQGDGHLSGCLDTVAPEGVGGNFHRGERYLGIGIPALGYGCAHTDCKKAYKGCKTSHNVVVFVYLVANIHFLIEISKEIRKK